MRKSVLVTGADGFIGNVLVPRLTRNFNFIVKAAVRKSKPYTTIENPYEIGEISGNTDWKEVLNGVDTIVHLAAIAHNKQSDQSYTTEVNVNGAINLAEQAVVYGVKRLIYISSISVLGSKSITPLNEFSKPSPKSHSAECKYQVEKRLTYISQTTSLEIVILRPALVYGAGAPGNFKKLTGLVRATPLLPFALCNNQRSFISIDNLVDFISLSVSHPQAKNEIFCISDNEDVSVKELSEKIAIGLNRKISQLPIPLSIFRLAGQILGKQDLVEQLVGDLVVDSSKARNLLDWTPPYTMSETLNNLVHRRSELI